MPVWLSRARLSFAARWRLARAQRPPTHPGAVALPFAGQVEGQHLLGVSAGPRRSRPVGDGRGGIFRSALDGGPFGHPPSFSVAELRPLTIAQVARLLGYTPRHVTRLYDRWAARQHDPTMPRVTTIPVAIGSGAKRAAKAVLWPVAA